MTNEEATAICNKAMKVILSCKTLEQLANAVKFAHLAYKKLAREIELINNVNFISLIERSIGFAQCQIKYAMVKIGD